MKLTFDFTVLGNARTSEVAENRRISFLILYDWTAGDTPAFAPDQNPSEINSTIQTRDYLKHDT